MVGQSLCGRVAEVSEIEHLVRRAKEGAGGGALILRGEAGIGKTALLDHAADRAAGMRVLAGAGAGAGAAAPLAARPPLRGAPADAAGPPEPAARAGRAAPADPADPADPAGPAGRLPGPQAAALGAALGLGR